MASGEISQFTPCCQTRQLDLSSSSLGRFRLLTATSFEEGSLRELSCILYPGTPRLLNDQLRSRRLFDFELEIKNSLQCQGNVSTYFAFSIPRVDTGWRAFLISNWSCLSSSVLQEYRRRRPRHAGCKTRIHNFRLYFFFVFFAYLLLQSILAAFHYFCRFLSRFTMFSRNGNFVFSTWYLTKK